MTYRVRDQGQQCFHFTIKKKKKKKVVTVLDHFMCGLLLTVYWKPIKI